MLVAGFPAGSFAANCYLVAAAPGEQCLIIDPGQDAEQGIEEIVERYKLQPAAVLADARPRGPHLVRGAGVRGPGHPGLYPPGRP